MWFMSLHQYKATPCSCQPFRFSFSILHSILPSSLGRIKDKLKDVSDRFEKAGHTAKSEDAKVVSELTGADFLVSCNTQPGTAT
jgi:hypothetical protein